MAALLSPKVIVNQLSTRYNLDMKRKLTTLNINYIHSIYLKPFILNKNQPIPQDDEFKTQISKQRLFLDNLLKEYRNNLTQEQEEKIFNCTQNKITIFLPIINLQQNNN